MARNREPVKPVESESESDKEEEEGSSEEESDSEPEAEQTQTATQKKSQPRMPAKSSPPRPASSSSEEEESGSETESESDASLASKPVVETKKSTNGASKVRSKPNTSEPVTPSTKSAAAKRPAEDTAAKDAKKSKKTAAEPETSEKKSNQFQRLWSEEDEIVILKGMIDYRSKYKSDPISDLNAFHDFIKNNVHVDVTRSQLQNKIRRLKRKYENNKSKERTLSKPHEQSAYDLSKTIWGNEAGKENGGVKVMGSPRAASKKESGEVKNGKWEEKLGAKRLNLNFSGATMEERMLIDGGEVFELGQGVEWEKEWNKLKVEELQLYLKQLEVRVAQTKLVLGVMEGSNN